MRQSGLPWFVSCNSSTFSKASCLLQLCIRSGFQQLLCKSFISWIWTKKNSNFKEHFEKVNYILLFDNLAVDNTEFSWWEKFYEHYQLFFAPRVTFVAAITVVSSQKIKNLIVPSGYKWLVTVTVHSKLLLCSLGRGYVFVLLWFLVLISVLKIG